MTPGAEKIFCPSCRQESTVKTEKKYDGFTPVGEVKTCAFCGYEFEGGGPEAIKEKAPDWAKGEGHKKVCHRCLHYLVNPFIQKCGLSQKEVKALDSCPKFSPKPPPKEEDTPDETKLPGFEPLPPPDIF